MGMDVGVFMAGHPVHRPEPRWALPSSAKSERRCGDLLCRWPRAATFVPAYSHSREEVAGQPLQSMGVAVRGDRALRWPRYYRDEERHDESVDEIERCGSLHRCCAPFIATADVSRALSERRARSMAGRLQQCSIPGGSPYRMRMGHRVGIAD